MKLVLSSSLMPAVAGRRVWDRRSGLLLRVGRRWMVLAASIVVHLATTTSATGIRVGVIDSCKARCWTSHWMWDRAQGGRTLTVPLCLPWPLGECENLHAS